MPSAVSIPFANRDSNSVVIVSNYLWIEVHAPYDVWFCVLVFQPVTFSTVDRIVMKRK